MLALMGIYLDLLALGVIGLMVYQYIQRRHDLLSLRNLFLIGFVLFQLTSTSIILFQGYDDQLRMSVLPNAAVEFAVLATLFLAIFLLAYHRGWGVRKLLRGVMVVNVMPSCSTLLLVILILTLVSLLLRFMVNIPLVSTLASLAGIGCAAIACGLMGWAWAQRPGNLALLAFGIVVALIHVLNVIYGSFGRRALLAVMLGGLWGVYYGGWRYRSAVKTLVILSLLSIGPILLIALYTSARNPGEHGRTTLEHIQALRETGDIKSGLLQLLDGQGTGAVSLWLIQNFPERFEYRHLHTLVYTLAYPIPRSWWPAKPEPLSVLIPPMAKIHGVNWGVLTLGPGIIGHAAAEGGFYAAIIYALALGLLMRFFDELVQLYPLSPFVVMLVGCNLGQILGAPRGETAAFLALYILTILGAWLCTLAIAKPIEINRRSALLYAKQ